MRAPSSPDGPSLEAIKANWNRISPYIRSTPILIKRGNEVCSVLGNDTKLVFKLELFQVTGTFKARGAITNLLALTPEARARGITAVSAGNHAIAAAYAASCVGAHAKVVMTSNANPARVASAKSYGTEILLVDGVHEAFERVEELAKTEGRTLIHPFEGENVALGTASLGLEFAAQAGPLDVLIVAIGGGGLAAGLSTAFKLVQPDCRIVGVEPEGADSMHRSFAAGTPQRIESVSTIADSLGSPMALPYSFGLCRAHVDDIVLVNDDQLCAAMALMFRVMKLAVEPAGAAVVAALCGPLREKISGKRVGLIICGSNIDIDSFQQFVHRGLASEGHGQDRLCVGPL